MEQCRFQCKRPYVIWGILNVTPDSFSDGDPSATVKDFIGRGEQLIADGADIIDVGGESTRAGALPISDEEEWRRLMPVLEAFRKNHTISISVDTYKSGVAELALSAGAAIVNDITGLHGDPLIAEVVAKHGAKVVVMYLRRAVDAQLDILCDISNFWTKSLKIAESAGIKKENIILDVGLGVGFHKTVEQNLFILRHLGDLLADFSSFEFMVGASRKSFIGAITGETEPGQRDCSSAAIGQLAFLSEVRHFRVHNVKLTANVLKLTESIHGVR
jgi:dihydropteroate synthase